MNRARDRETLIRIENRDDASLSVMVDDDGEVVWAFLLENGKISGDVWLCNRGPAPKEFERRSGPPLNVAGYFDPKASLPRLRAKAWTAVFLGDAADVFLDGAWIAQLRLGTKPGWSLFATKSNAAARPLAETVRLGSERPIKTALRRKAMRPTKA